MGSEGARGHAASRLPAAQGTEGGWKMVPGDMGTNRGHGGGLGKGFGISVLG